MKRRHNVAIDSNKRMFMVMLFNAIVRRLGKSLMAITAALVGSATLFCLTAICLSVPEQIHEDLRAYGANVIVTPKDSFRGINNLQISKVTRMLKSYGSLTYANYRYENIRIHSLPYVVAGIHVDQVKALNHHWEVEGAWPKEHNVLVGRNVADKLGVTIGSRIRIGYRSSDNGRQLINGGTSMGGSAHAIPVPDNIHQHTHIHMHMHHHHHGDSGATDNHLSELINKKKSHNESSSAENTGEMTHSNAPKQSNLKGLEGRTTTNILQNGGTEFRVCGIVDTGGNEDDLVYATLQDVVRLSQETRGSDVVEYSINAGTAKLKKAILTVDKDQSLALQAQQVTKITSADTRIITMLQTLFWIVSAVVLLLTLVGVSTTIFSIVAGRRNEIGLRKALGASSESIAHEFFAASALYGFIGGIIGTAVGYICAYQLCIEVFHRDIGVHPWLVVLSIVVSVLISVVASIPPVRVATHIDPAIVLREE